MQQAKTATQLRIPPEVQKHYMQMKNDYSTLFKSVINLEEEKRENILVLDAIKDLNPDRKCWRSVGGVLVERTIGEVIPALRGRIDDELTQKLNVLNEKLSAKQKDLLALEKKLGIKSKGESAQKDEDKDKKGNQNIGVLA